MLGAITAGLTALKEFFGWRTAAAENRSNHEVVRDKKSLKRGTNYAERIFDITDRYVKYFEERDVKRYKNLKKLFNKYN